MLSTSLIAVALAGVATAFTPPGFEPASTANLTVAFGNTLAINGVDLPKSETQTAPTVGTAERLTGTYAIMMVDPDIPPKTEGGPTSELLHWMQGGLVSANTSTTIAGVKVFELTNPTNTAAFASYVGPSPPNRSPTSHRYTQLLMRTDTNSSVLTTLAKFGMTRSNFSAVNVVRAAGLTVLAGNSFNVTANSNTTGIGSGNGSGNGGGNNTNPPLTTSTQTVIGSTPTSKGNATTSIGLPKANTCAGRVGRSAFIAGCGALAAAVVIL